MQDNITLLEKEQEKVGAKDALAEILGEIEAAEAEQRKVLIKPAQREKARYYFENYRKEKIIMYFMSYIILIANLIIQMLDGIVFEGDTPYFTLIAFFAIFSGIAVEKERVAYVKRLISDMPEFKIKQLAFYVFGYVPQLRYVAIAVTLTILLIILLLIQNYSNIININLICGLFITVLTPFFELIFIKKIKK